MLATSWQRRLSFWVEAAAEAKATVLGAFSDQTSLAPGLMATSIVNNNAAIVVMVASSS